MSSWLSIYSFCSSTTPSEPLTPRCYSDVATSKQMCPPPTSNPPTKFLLSSAPGGQPVAHTLVSILSFFYYYHYYLTAVSVQTAPCLCASNIPSLEFLRLTADLPVLMPPLRSPRLRNGAEDQRGEPLERISFSFSSTFHFRQLMSRVTGATET